MRSVQFNDTGAKFIVGKYYTYVGETTPGAYVKGESYKFIGIIKCVCGPGCTAFKSLFEGVYEYEDHFEEWKEVLDKSPVLKGADPHSFISGTEEQSVDDLIEETLI